MRLNKPPFFYVLLSALFLSFFLSFSFSLSLSLPAQFVDPDLSSLSSVYYGGQEDFGD